MTENSRRAFLADVGRGMLVASLGPALCGDLCLAGESTVDDPGALSFGELEPLVALMEESEPDALLARLVAELRSGAELRTLVTAGALANARSFGGEDYTGYHAFMALLPAYQMAEQLPRAESALPALKVLYRSTARIRERGGAPVLRRIDAEDGPAADAGAALREAVLARDVDRAERAFSVAARRPAAETYAALLPVVRDDANVHRIVLAWRAWDLRRLTGEPLALTLLRQSVRFCVDAEKASVRNQRPEPRIRTLLPELLETLARSNTEAPPRQADDAWLEELSGTIFGAGSEAAATAAAAALAQGFDPEAVGEAISLAANRLLLHDPGRSRAGGPDKPLGSVHGASVGVHASDAANAWRNVARVGDATSAAASLIVGAYHTAGQSASVGPEPMPFQEAAQASAETGPALLGAAAEAIRGRDQMRAAGLVERYGALGHAAEPVFDLLLGFAVSQDGALHAEKYFRTVVEEFADTRPSRRWRHLVGLARVTASAYGYPAPGIDEARRLLLV